MHFQQKNGRKKKNFRKTENQKKLRQPCISQQPYIMQRLKKKIIKQERKMQNMIYQTDNLEKKKRLKKIVDQYNEYKQQRQKIKQNRMGKVQALSHVPKKIINNDIQIEDQIEMEKNGQLNVIRNKIMFDIAQTEINKILPNLINKNIPAYEHETTFNRNKLHNLFSKFKAMLRLKSEKVKDRDVHPRSIINQGLDIQTIKNSFSNLATAPASSIEILFEKLVGNSEDRATSKLDWDKFIRILDLTEAKSITAKISLIKHLLDRDGSGTLSFQEIKIQSCHMLEQMFTDSNNFSINDIADMLTRMIFQATNTPLDQELDTNKLQEEIESRNKDVELLLMICFCSMDEEENEDSDQEEVQIKYNQKKTTILNANNVNDYQFSVNIQQIYERDELIDSEEELKTNDRYARQEEEIKNRRIVKYEDDIQ